MDKEIDDFTICFLCCNYASADFKIGQKNHFCKLPMKCYTIYGGRYGKCSIFE